MKIVIIGGGPAGEAAAKVAVRKKAKVLLIEKENLGGLCLNRGCIPSKTLLSIGKKIHEFKGSEVLQSCFEKKSSLHSESVWKNIQQKKKRVIEELRAGLGSSLQREGIETIYGAARFVSPNQVSITSSPRNKLGAGSLGTPLEMGIHPSTEGNSSPSPMRKSGGEEERIENFDKCIIAVGSRVSYPPPFNQFQEELLDSDKVLELESLPESMAVIGGGAVGCEYACLFHELDIKITLIEMTPYLLPGEDAQISRALLNSFEKRGIEIFLSTTVQHLSKTDGTWKMALSNGNEIQTQTILVCTGRKANFESLDLGKAQVQSSASGIAVNQNLLTSNPNIYAVGDVNGLSLLAHAGSKQGEIAAAHALGERKSYDGQLVPRCLYTWPEVASVGMWQVQAESKGMEVKSQRFFFQASGRAVADGESEGFIQIITDKKSQKILGAQIIGPCATELIHIISVALQKQMRQEELKDLIFAHPTLSEGIRIALER